MAIQLLDDGQLEDLQTIAVTVTGAADQAAKKDDFSGDGFSDVPWLHHDGTVAVWLMNGADLIGNATIGSLDVAFGGFGRSSALGAVSHDVSLGDFDGDGHTDVLWRHDSGHVVLWQM